MGIYCRLHASPDVPWSGVMHTGPTLGSADLDKTWHALHFLLSGTADAGAEPNQFLLGGTQIPETSEHCCFQRHAAVEAFSRVLELVDDDELLGRLDRPRMKALGIYAEPWEWSDEFARSFLLQHLTPLRAFISQHAREGHAVLITIL